MAGPQGEISLSDVEITMKVLKILPEKIEKDKIRNIVSVLRKDGIVIYPTETFYGLGVNAYSARAVEKVYRLKKRIKRKPLSVVISDLEMLWEVAVNVPPVFEVLEKAFWPGSLTMVLPASSKLPQNLLAEGSTVGVRWPDFSWLQALIKEAGFPLTATSANLSGEKEISKVDEISSELSTEVDLIIDGGETPGKLPSTVIDLTFRPPRLLREGMIRREAIEKVRFSSLL